MSGVEGLGKPTSHFVESNIRSTSFHSTLLMLGVLVNAVFPASPVAAITIRHDVPDATYKALSAQPQFATAGALQNPFGWCTATLIHPEWVLTASHCINSNNVNAFTFSMGADRNNPTLSRITDATATNPAFNINAAEQGSDFGLLHFSQPILGATPARVYRGGISEIGRNATTLGYGFTGNGLTGENQALPLGSRRASENVVDADGTIASWSSSLLLSDFDNPTNASDSSLGGTTPTPTEGAVALYDSGGGWFQQINGVWYLTAVTSFRADSDGSSNSDYGDVNAAGRTSSAGNLNWIDTSHDRSLFWNGGTGNWQTTSAWYGGIKPGAANAAVIDTGVVSIVNSGETAEYTFVAGAGTLNLRNNLATNYLIVRDSGQLTFGSPTAAVVVTGSLQHEAGTLAFEIAGASSGNFDALTVSGSALLSGTINVTTVSGYGGPTARGTVDAFTLITAASVDNQLDLVAYNGTSLNPGLQFAGANEAGTPGLFRRLDVTSTTLTVSNYLALAGDANGDGSVDGSDFGIWNANKFRSGTNWITGDFNGDGITDGSDFGIWNANKFTSVRSAIAVIPEPSTWGAIALVLVAWRRRSANASLS